MAGCAPKQPLVTCRYLAQSEGMAARPNELDYALQHDETELQWRVVTGCRAPETPP